MSKPNPAPAQSDYGDCTPAQTAQVLPAWCRAKAGHDTARLVTLGLMAGAFIALGAVLFTTVMVGVPASLGPFRLIGGIAFAMGLLMVCMTGAELSTGNCMLAAAASHGEMSPRAMWRILALSFAANAAGALVVALLMHGTGLFDGKHGRVLIAVAEAKSALPPVQAFTRAVLCNALVCIAVWMILAGQTLPSKLAGLMLPIAAFVACGFEHSIANFYFLPAGAMAGADIGLGAAVANLTLVTAGNFVGGTVVALALYHAHLARAATPAAQAAHGPPLIDANATFAARQATG